MKQIHVVLIKYLLLLLAAVVPQSSFWVVAEAPTKVLSTGESVDAFVKTKTDANTIMVFAKSYCPHCRQTKELLEESYSKIKFEIVNLDQLGGNNDGFEIQHHLSEITGQWTVPNIFVHQKPVGGNSDLQQLHASGKLRELLVAGGTASGTAEL